MIFKSSIHKVIFKVNSDQNIHYSEILRLHIIECGCSEDNEFKVKILSF